MLYPRLLSPIDCRCVCRYYYVCAIYVSACYYMCVLMCVSSRTYTAPAAATAAPSSEPAGMATQGKAAN